MIRRRQSTLQRWADHEITEVVECPRHGLGEPGQCICPDVKVLSDQDIAAEIQAEAEQRAELYGA